MKVKAIEISDLSFAYKDIPVIKKCKLDVACGEMVLIVGGNGSGKSTLVKLMLGELKPDNGEIKILGKDISSYKSYKKIGYVPQINIVNKISFPITCKELVVLNLYEDFSFIKIAKKKPLPESLPSPKRYGHGRIYKYPSQRAFWRTSPKSNDSKGYDK